MKFEELHGCVTSYTFLTVWTINTLWYNTWERHEFCITKHLKRIYQYDHVSVCCSSNLVYRTHFQSQLNCCCIMYYVSIKLPNICLSQPTMEVRKEHRSGFRLCYGVKHGKNGLLCALNKETLILWWNDFVTYRFFSHNSKPSWSSGSSFLDIWKSKIPLNYWNLHTLIAVINYASEWYYIPER